MVINEVIANTAGVDNALDAIELMNTTTSAVDIGGWYLSDSGDNPLKFQIPAGKVIGPLGYVMFDESDFNPTPNSPAAHHFALSGTEGDDVWLVIGDGHGQ